MVTGTIFSIEEFALSDGPGIRTTVFLKGCPLRCRWCHNPEGISFMPQMLQTKEGERMCGEEVEASELAKKLLRHQDIFESSGGGITFTGGEPLSQPKFLAEMLRLVKPVHTAIETCGYSPATVFEKIVPLTDLMLFDIKCMDSSKHKEYTGKDNAPILQNLKWLCGSGHKFIIRLPLMPGVNDSKEDMERVLKAIKDAKGLEWVEMLRYHKTAGAKYQMAGQAYDPGFDTQTEVAINNVFESYNIKTIIL